MYLSLRGIVDAKLSVPNMSPASTTQTCVDTNLKQSLEH